MIQRKQTLFLLLAFILNAVCLCLPVATLVPEGMGVDQPMTNLWIVASDGPRDFTPWPLFALLIVGTALALIAIFLFRNRHLQAMLCMIGALLMLSWLIVYVYFALTMGEDRSCSFRLSFVAVIPVISFVLFLLARRGILADEALVRSMDRIR